MFIIVGGVVEFDFSRLLEIADVLCEDGVLDPKKYKSSNRALSICTKAL